MKANRNEVWDKVMKAGEQAAYAYQQMVAAADELAGAMEYNEDYVLLRVLPKTASERRDSERILRWLEKARGEIEGHVLARLAAADKAARRQALLAKLNLTGDEKRLLGIREAE